MMKLGFNMAGCEDVFQRYLFMRAQEAPSGTFRYLEVGVGDGGTFLPVTEKLDEWRPEWTAYGIDIEWGAFFFPKDFLQRCRWPVVVGKGGITKENYLQPFGVYRGVAIGLDGRKSLEALTHMALDDSIGAEMLKMDFALIDGCHGEQCVMEDFFLVDKLMATRGMVAFHDSGAREQGTMIQEHCSKPIGVRSALYKVGLGLSAKEITRPGWAFLDAVEGDANNGGHGMALFIKQV